MGAANGKQRVMLAAALALAAGFAVSFGRIVPPDAPIFLYAWLDHILRNGAVGAFADPFSNYSPPYLYLLAAGSLLHPWLTPLAILKLVAALCHAALVAAAFALGRAAMPDRAIAAAALAIVLPTALANSLLLAQCDTLLAAAILMLVTAAMRDRTLAMLAWFGVALAINLQAIFIGPFLLAMLLARRVPVRWWPLPLVVVAALWLPAMMAGWPPADLTMVYLKQTQWNRDFVNNASGLWALIVALDPRPSDALIAAGVAAAGIAGAALAGWLRRLPRDPAAILAAATLSVLILPFLMPRMHERYLFLADALAAMLAVAARSRRAIAVAILMQLSSQLALAAYLAVEPKLLLAGAAASAAALGLTIAILRERLKNDASVAN